MKNLNQSKIRFLLLALFLTLFSLSGLYSQSVLVETSTLQRWSKQNKLLEQKLLNSLNYEHQRASDREKWLGIIDEQANSIQNLETELEQQELRTEQIWTTYETQLELWEIKEKKLKASSLKNNFIVGGITFGVTVLITVPLTIYLYDKYFKQD